MLSFFLSDIPCYVLPVENCSLFMTSIPECFYLHGEPCSKYNVYDNATFSNQGFIIIFFF